jgi:hypothetical protein
MRRAVAYLTAAAAALTAMVYVATTEHYIRGYDFYIFYAAARALLRGGNPYDVHAVYLQERVLYSWVHDPQQARFIQLNPFVQGSPLLAALEPLQRMSPEAAYYLEVALLVLCAFAAAIILLRLYRLPYALPWMVLAVGGPVTYVGLLAGQVDAAFVLLLAGALWATRHDRWALCGACMAGVLVKPQLMIGPLLLWGWLAWRRGHAPGWVAGLVAAVVVIMGSSLVVGSPRLLPEWATQLRQFSGAAVYAQGNVSSLSALYLGWLPHGLTTFVALGIAAAWVVLAAILWRCVDQHGAEWWLAVGTVAWTLATPYAHPHDSIIVLPALAWIFALRGTAPSWRALLALVLVTFWITPFVYLFDPWAQIDVLHIPLVGTAFVPLIGLVLLLVRAPARATAPRAAAC